MLIFVDQISERLVYIKEFIFDAHGIEGKFTNDKNYFLLFEGEKCIYSDLSHRWNSKFETFCFTF